MASEEPPCTPVKGVQQPDFLSQMNLLKRAFEAGNLDEDEYRAAKRVATSRMMGVPVEVLTPSSINTIDTGITKASIHQLDAEI